MSTGMAGMADVTAPRCGGAHGETPEMAEMVEMDEIPETPEIFELETCVMPEITGTYETHGISGIRETCGTLVMSEIFGTHGSRCTTDTGIHGI